MNPARALATLRRQAALPLSDEERAVTLAAAMLLELYLNRGDCARRSPHFEERTDARAPGAALRGGGFGEHEQLATPPLSARLAARVEPAGSKG